MIGQLESVWGMVARASWQASLLAAIVALVVWCCGERLSARWRYLLLSVVLVRLLLLIAPASPWSLYQLAAWPGEPVRMTANVDPQAELALLPRHESNVAPQPLEIPPAPVPAVQDISVQQPPIAVQTRDDRPDGTEAEARADSAILATTVDPPVAKISLRAVLALAWLAGFAFFAGRLLWALVGLQRKLSRCQPIQDETTLRSLESVRQQLGVRRKVRLLVTAEPVSPCVVGVLRPRLVMPELALTELSDAALRQVFAHELAHVAHGDLWMNWLMLVARCVHWFNPVAWWMVREMQSLREMACDERTLAALDADQRAGYAETILSLVGLCAPSPLAPGMVALFSSRARLSRRIEHLARGRFGSRRARALAAGLLVLLALVGWTDAGQIVAQESGEVQPPATKDSQTKAADSNQATSASESAPHEMRGQTLKWVATSDGPNRFDSVPVGEVEVDLYEVRGLAGTPTKVAETTSDAEGRFSFTVQERPRNENYYDRLAYGLVLRAPGQPPNVVSYYDDGGRPEGFRIAVGGTPATVSGRVVDERGRPISGAVVYRQGIQGRPIAGVLSATTDADGRFSIEDLSISLRSQKSEPVHFNVEHPDYPKLEVRTDSSKIGNTTQKPAAELKITIPDGCKLRGVVNHEATGKPVVGALVIAQSNERVADDAVAVTDDEGRYQLVVAEGNYNLFAETDELVCRAGILGLETTSGTAQQMSPLLLNEGGWIEGHVVNTETGKPIVEPSEAYPEGQRPPNPGGPNERVAIGLFGPAYPPRTHVISQEPLVRVDEQGRFRVRAAAGDNYPYFSNVNGARMAWDTRKQPPVVVKTGETTHYDMLITPKPTDEEKMRVAAEVMASLPDEMPARVEAILAEFRKLNSLADKTEIWCSLMRELVAIGPAAVPALCAELDATNDQRMMRILGFALRAIGDPRAVPALIRAIPKSLQPPLSDYGMRVADDELAKFMQKHDTDRKNRGREFDFGRPVREVCIALEVLTGQNLGEEELYSVNKSEDPSGAAAQRKLYRQQAEKWQAWWEAHWQEFTQDEAYRRVGLPEEEPYQPAPFAVLGESPHAGSGMAGFVLSPPNESGTHFLDLDTGLERKWPESIPRGDASAAGDQAELALWAARNGIDLMCVTYQIGDEQVYALRSFNMRLAEISLRDAKYIERFLERRELPASEPVGELLLPLDKATGRYAAGKAAFLYETREGGLGVIELTDQITTARDITGALAAPQGVGFHKGAKFNFTRIVR